MKQEFALEINHLTKNFGQQIAVNDVSFNIKRGEVFALLGPNGAGKTTVLRMLTTLLKPTSGTIKMLGHDVQTESKMVRSLFGLTGQYASIDEDLSAHENLMIFARLNGLTHQEANQRTQELLEEFSLVNSADKVIANFSGGMRRRLDLAVSLIARPALIFLDEPTTGLDPRTRVQMWSTIRQLVASGSTIILTTQYLEEADELADRIALIDHGKLVGLGTPEELKQKVAGNKLHLQFITKLKASQSIPYLTEILNENISQLDDTITVKLHDIDCLRVILNHLKDANLKIISMDIEHPSLDDVFFTMTTGKN